MFANSLMISLAVLVSSFVQQAHARVACRDAFGAAAITYVSSEDFPARMFARAEGGPMDATYLGNMRFTSRSFQTWLVGGVPPAQTQPQTLFQQHGLADQQLAPELRFLRSQHLAVVFGDGQNGTYWPGLKMEADTLAGAYRHWIHTAKYKEALEHHQILSAFAKNEIEQARGAQAKLVTMTSGIPQTRYQVKVAGISSADWPTYRFDGMKAVYFYPSASQLQAYLAPLGQALAEIRQRVGEYRVNKNSEPVLASLGRYYHLAMTGHPFVRANNSLVMAQVNVVLREIGLREVVHGELDYIVRSLDSQQAEAYFVQYVKSLQ